MPPWTCEIPPGAIGGAPDPRSMQSPQGGATARSLHRRALDPHLAAGRDTHVTMHDHPNAIGLRFFSLVQAHVAESARSVSAATNTPSRNATKQNYGTARRAEHAKTNRDGWLLQMASCSVSTGNSQEAVGQPVTQSGTNAQGAGKPITGLKAALEWRRLEPLPPYIKKHGRSSWKNVGWTGDTRSSFRVSRRVLMWGYPASHARTPCQIMPLSNPSQMYIIALLISSLNRVVTSGLSCVANWNQPWAPSKPRPCPWYQKHRNQGSSGLYIIFPTRTTLPPTLRPSTCTSIAMTSPAPGELSRLWPCSSPNCPPDPKPPFEMWRKHIERYPLNHHNGLGLSFGCRQTTNLQSIPATTSVSPQWEGHTSPWQMRGWTFSEEKGWAPSRSGLMIMYFSEFLGLIYLVTTCSMQNGARRSRPTVDAGRKAAACGMAGKRCQVALRRSSTRIAPPPSKIFPTHPHVTQKIGSSHTQTSTSIGSLHAWVSSGSPPS